MLQKASQTQLHFAPGWSGGSLTDLTWPAALDFCPCFGPQANISTTHSVVTIHPGFSKSENFNHFETKF